MIFSLLRHENLPAVNLKHFATTASIHQSLDFFYFMKPTAELSFRGRGVNTAALERTGMNAAYIVWLKELRKCGITLECRFSN